MVRLQLEGGHLFDPSQNFWELNPQFRYHKPYSKLYDRDESKNKETSSKEMWCVVFMGHPDDEINIYYKMSPNERMEMLKDTLAPNIEWDDPELKECVDSFPEDCLSSEEKSLKIELDALRKRAIYLRDTPINNDTARTYNMIQKDSGKVYDNYEKVKEKFLRKKAQVKAKGGRDLTKSEKGELW